MTLSNEDIFNLVASHQSPKGAPKTPHRHNGHSTAEDVANPAATSTPDVADENGHCSALQADCGGVADKAPEQTAKLINEVGAFVRRFVVLAPEQELAVALHVMHTWTFEAAEATPYLHVSSAERESGKTRLLEVLELLTCEAMLTENISEAALFRSVRESQPTILFDEVDAIFGPKARDREDLRGMLNAGHRKGSYVMRCVGDGSNQKVERFPVFCPKVLAGLGTLPDTLASRSIPIRLKRRTKRESVERFRRRQVKSDADRLGADLWSWSRNVLDALTAAEPELPDQLSDREMDCWEPLLAIADLAEAGHLARECAVRLMTGRRESSDSTGVELLAAIRDVLTDEHISTVHLIAALNGREEERWGGWNDGAGLRPRNLASLLEPFEIKSRSVRIGDRTPKGYARESFEDAWRRYLPERKGA